jgi:ribonuclease HI
VLYLYTDGSAGPTNPGPGGWSVVTEREVVASGHEPHTTNNRMEGRAIVEAIRHAAGRECVILTDSRVWVDTLTKWAPGWQARGWRRRDGEVANLDLVQEALEALQGSRCSLVWVKGHAGSPGNERADRAANEARKAGASMAAAQAVHARATDDSVHEPAGQPEDRTEGNGMKFSNSELRAFKRCRRKWWVTYYRRLALRKDGVGPLSIGNMIHHPLEMYYSTESRDPETFDWETPLAAYVEGRLAHPEFPEHLHADLLKEFELAKKMLRGYFEWLVEEGADSEIEFMAAEEEVEAYLGNVEGTDVWLIGKLDARIRLKSDGRAGFLDHKSAANLTDLPKMALIEEQFKTYGLLQRLKAVADGTLADASQFAHGGVWNMLRKVGRTAAAKPPFYGRSGVTHNDEVYRQFFVRVWGEVRDILRVRAELDAGADHQMVAYPNPTRDCSWDCPLFPICHQFDDGSDVESVLQIEFAPSDPYERYTEVEKG